MSGYKQIKSNILILISLFFLTFLFFGKPAGIHTAFAVEMPPMPGQVYHKSEPGEESKDVESLPPAVKKMDEQIKRDTKVLRRGFSAPELEPKAESEPGPEYEAKPEYSPPFPKATTKSGKEQPVAETKTSMPLKKEAQSDSYAPSGDKSAGDKTAGATSEDKSATGCAIGVATSGKISNIGFFLKGLIIFSVVGTVGFLLLRKFVFKT